MLAHLNRRYGGNFLARNFAYRSQYNVPLRRNEIRLESLVDQEVTLSALGFSTWFARAELIDAEVMYKFDPIELAGLLDRAGFSMVHRWIDPGYRYGLFLLRRQ
jgi:L-histidine N-alpha-methyltransferase